MPRRSATSNIARIRTPSPVRSSTKTPEHHSSGACGRAQQRWTAAKQHAPACVESPASSPVASRTARAHVSRDGSVTLRMGDVAALSAPATLRPAVQPHLHVSRDGRVTLTVGARTFAVPLGDGRDRDSDVSVVNPLLSALAPPTPPVPRAVLPPAAVPCQTRRTRSAPVPRRPVPHDEEERRFAVLVAAAAAARRRIAHAHERAAQLAEQARLEEKEEKEDARRLAQARAELAELRRIAEGERVEAERVEQARAELERVRRLAAAERAAMEIVRAQRAKLERELLERAERDQIWEASAQVAARTAAAAAGGVDAAAAAAAAGSAHARSAAERARDASNYAARQ